MQSKINFMFALISIVLVAFVRLLAWDNYNFQQKLFNLEQEVQLQDEWIAMAYQTTFGVYRIAITAYNIQCSGDRQFKFDCLLDDWEQKSWRQDLLSNDK